VRRALAVILFLFEPYLAATLLLRAAPALLGRDVISIVAFAIRMVLALASVAAAIGLRDARPGADRLATGVLAASAAFAVFQYFTRALPTSLEPALGLVVTIVVVVHHATWIAALNARTSQRSGRGSGGL
jgi:hypothetical protein